MMQQTARDFATVTTNVSKSRTAIEPCQYSVAEMDEILDHAEMAMDGGEGIASDAVFSSMEAKYPFLCK